MKRSVSLPAAEQEMLDAAAYYEAQAPGLGGDSPAEEERALKSVVSNPETWPVIEGALHRRMLRRFPVGIF